MRIRSIRTLLSALLFAVVVLSLSTASFAQVGVAIDHRATSYSCL
jgi:hypothetical protein